MNQRSVDGWSREGEDLATLVERGRRLHSEAVFEACVRVLGLRKRPAPEKVAPPVTGDREGWSADRA